LFDSLSALIEGRARPNGFRFERDGEVLESQLRQVPEQESIGTLAGGMAHEFNNVPSPEGTAAPSSDANRSLGARAVADAAATDLRVNFAAAR